VTRCHWRHRQRQGTRRSSLVQRQSDVVPTHPSASGAVGRALERGHPILPACTIISPHQTLRQHMKRTQPFHPTTKKTKTETTAHTAHATHLVHVDWLVTLL